MVLSHGRGAPDLAQLEGLVPPMTQSVELAAVFERAVDDRLLSAERLVLTWPGLFGGALSGCDIGYQTKTHMLLAIARYDAKVFRPALRSRFEFWGARAGGQILALPNMREKERVALLERLSEGDVKLERLAPRDLGGALDQIASAAGAPPGEWALPEEPERPVDLGARGAEGVGYDPEEKSLFMPGSIAPPAGDEILLSLRIPPGSSHHYVKARVSFVRSEAGAGPGRPAGFGLALVAPPALLTEALARHFAAHGERVSFQLRRAMPRYRVRAPARWVRIP